jgi:hypothetical protein
LAGTLNQDQELMQAIAGLDRGSASLGIGPAAAGFWTTLHVMANEEEGYVGLWQPSLDPYVLPTELDLMIAERVTRHVQQFVP